MVNDGFLKGLIDKKFIEKKHIKKIIPVEKLYSKKNKLYRVRFITDSSGEEGSVYFVFKLYLNGEKGFKKDKESLMLRALGKHSSEYSINVPGIFYEGKDFLITEFIEGGTLLDYILVKESENEDINFGKLNPLVASCKVINDFYYISKKITGDFCISGDVNLRNFIINSGIYRIDFEDWHRGCIEEDFGKFMAFTLTYEPFFSDWKVRLVRELGKYICESFSINKDKLTAEIDKEFKSMVNRRSLSPDIFDREKIKRIIN